MQAIEKVPSSSSNQLPSGCALPLIRSLFMEQATREAGNSLSEIMGIMDLMRQAYEQGELNSLQFRLTLLLDSAANLSFKVSNIIALSNLCIEPSQSRVRDFDVASLANEAAHTARSLAARKPVTIMDAASPVPCFIRSDQDKVRQIIAELLNNAVKFTDRGRIALILNRTEDGIRLKVTDNGLGMSAEHIAAALTEDDREIDAARALPGVGLRIAARLAQALGGRLTITSKLGKGTIAEVAIPSLTVAARGLERSRPSALSA